MTELKGTKAIKQTLQNQAKVIRSTHNTLTQLKHFNTTFVSFFHAFYTLPW